MSEPILRVEDLKVHYHIKVRNKLIAEKKTVYAVDGITFDIYEGESIGVVGESGCGKSTLCKAIIGLENPTAGKIYLRGKDMSLATKEERFKNRQEIQMIFQDVYSTLDPRFTIGRSIEEPLVVHKIGTPAERKERVLKLLDLVGLPESYLNRYPHEFSGGQRQRIGIARALALRPSIMLCDEPVSALDVSIQAQILNLMKDLQKNLKITYVFVSHNLSVVKHLCDRVIVMYLGNIVEIAACEELYDNSLHPYTQALIGAVPIPDPDYELSMKPLEGDIPSPINVPPGCPFASRCQYAQEKCRKEKPTLKNVGNEHQVACHLYEDK